MKILLDVDDVLLDLMSVTLWRYNEEFGDNLTHERITEWEISKLVKPEAKKRILEYFDEPNTYEQAQPVYGALLGVAQLLRKGHEVLYVTANKNPGQFACLHRHGFFSLTEGPVAYIQWKNKSVFDADVLVDDRLKNIIEFPGSGILFDQPWNRDFVWDAREYSWEGVFQRIEEIETANANVKATHVSVVSGMGKDAHTTTSSNGGKQSKLDYRFDLVDPLTMFAIAKVLAEGASKYGEENWRLIPLRDNLNHALSHAYAYLAGDKQDDHLSHMFTRTMFALAQHLAGGK